MKLAELTAATGIEAHSWDGFVDGVTALREERDAAMARAEAGPQEPGPAAEPSEFVHVRESGDGRPIITSA